VTDKKIKYWKIFSIILIIIGVALVFIGYFILKCNEGLGIGLMFIGIVGFLVTGLPILGRAIDEKRIHRYDKR